MDNKINLLDEKSNKRKNSSLSSFSINICSHLIAGSAVGSFLGYQLDNIFGTKPILFIICFLLANIASGILIYRDFNN